MIQFLHMAGSLEAIHTNQIHIAKYLCCFYKSFFTINFIFNNLLNNTFNNSMDSVKTRDTVSKNW